MGLLVVGITDFVACIGNVFISHLYFIRRRRNGPNVFKILIFFNNIFFLRWISNNIQYNAEQNIITRRIAAQRAYLKSRDFSMHELSRVTQCEEIQSASKMYRIR